MVSSSRLRRLALFVVGLLPLLLLLRPREEEEEEDGT